MKRRLFSLALVVLAIAMALIILPACGGNNGTNTSTGSGNSNTNTGSTNTNTGGTQTTGVTYTVYFENQNGQPIEGINAQLCLPGGFCLPPRTSDAEGVCKFQYTELAALELQINEVPDGYIMIDGYIPFPDGRTSMVVTIQQNLTYTVTASDLHGNKLENVMVELYKTEGDELVDSKITGSNGRVEFTVSPDKYYAKVKHAFDNAAFTLINDTDVISFEKSRNAQVQFIISNGNIDYSVSLKDDTGASLNDVTVNLYNSKFQCVGTATTAEGVATFKTPNGLYYAQALVDGDKYAKTVIFEKNGTTSADVVVESVKAGSDKQHAIMILGDLNITVDAGEQIWYSVPFAKGKTLKVENASVEILYGGKTNKPNGGVITLELKEEGEAAFRITSKATEQINVTGEIYKLGSLETPNEISVDSDYTFTGVSVGENGRVYYSFVANKDGTVRITTNTDYAMITINGNLFKKSVREGDTVVICFYTQKEVGDSISAPAAEIDAELTFEQTNADYSVTVKVDNAISSGTVVELYESVDGEYVLLMTGTTNEDGVYVFENLVETADYYVKAIIESDYETVNEYDPFGDTTDVVLYVTHKRDGSQRYPYLLDSEEGTNTTQVTVSENGEVWYTVFYITGSTITIEGEGATAEIYTQTGDGTPAFVTTLVGENNSYTLDENFGTTTRLLIKIMTDGGEEKTVQLTYTAPAVEEENN